MSWRQPRVPTSIDSLGRALYTILWAVVVTGVGLALVTRSHWPLMAVFIFSPVGIGLLGVGSMIEEAREARREDDPIMRVVGAGWAWVAGTGIALFCGWLEYMMLSEWIPNILGR